MGILVHSGMFLIMGNAGFISSTVGVGSIGLRFRDRVSESASGFCRFF